MAGGYTGKLLRVNLSDRTIATEELEEAFCRLYLGGAGFVSYYALREIPPRIDPLSPENKIIFAAGPITGTLVQGGARNCVGGKSPLTGGFSKAEVSGFWGAELKLAGFDVLIVEGKAEHPVYIWVHDGEAEIRDATHLWGLPVKETQEAMRHELGDRLVRTALIGPAGENMVKFAAVINDVAGHSAGRGSMAPVMGSKNLKGIAARGRQAPQVVNPAKVREMVRWFVKGHIERRADRLPHAGTGLDSRGGYATGNLPVNNFQGGLFEEGAVKISLGRDHPIRVTMEGCHACAVRCKKVVKAEEPWVVDPEYGGPEYETLASMGSTCGVDEMVAIAKAGEICNALGMDTISCGVTVAFGMECFEKGLLTLEDTGGIDLRFGNAEALVKVVEMIGRREGIGDILAEGTRGAAQRIGRGAEEFAMHVKGLEVPMHEPRNLHSRSVIYAVNPAGADHCIGAGEIQSQSALQTLGQWGYHNINILPTSGIPSIKMNIGRDNYRWALFRDSMVMCNFANWNREEHITLMRAVTGWDYSEVEALRLGERVATMGRAFNFREGLTDADDRLPERFFGPGVAGPLATIPNKAVNREDWNRARLYWYHIMGWTPEGIPTREKMLELGVTWVADELSLPSILEARVPVAGT